MGEAYITRRGGVNPLNFKVVGNPQPSNPTENTIWVNTDTAITGWHFGAEEPNVYDIRTASADSLHHLICHRKLSVGDILNFTIPATVPYIYEALRIEDATGKQYCIRLEDGNATPVWDAGLKVSVLITNNLRPIGDWVGDGTAYIRAWHKYLHNEGTVWFPTGTTSPVAFNALKKNSIQVYPISAKQYVGGVWVNKTAQTYQGGKWCDWLTEVPFFADGTFNTAQFGDITGSYSLSNGAIRLGRHSGVSHTVAFDLTPFSTLEVVTSKYNDVVGQVKLKNKSGTEVASVGYAGLGTHVLDVSSLTGEHYINITCGSNSDNDYTDLSSIKFLI